MQAIVEALRQESSELLTPICLDAAYLFSSFVNDGMIIINVHIQTRSMHGALYFFIIYLKFWKLMRITLHLKVKLVEFCCKTHSSSLFWWKYARISAMTASHAKKCFVINEGMYFMLSKWFCIVRCTKGVAAVKFNV